MTNKKSPAKKSPASGKGSLKITLVKSGIARLPAHRATLQGLGLRRIGQTVLREDTREIRGMINNIAYMLAVEQN